MIWILFTALNDNLQGFTPVIDESTGKITGYKTTLGGADTVFPFSSESRLQKIGSCSDSSEPKEFDCTSLTNYKNMNLDDFVIVLTGLTRKNGSGNSSTILTKSYNSATGILTVSNCCYSTNGYLYINAYDVYATV